MIDRNHWLSLPVQDTRRMAAFLVASLVLLANLVILAGFLLQFPLFTDIAGSQAAPIIGTVEALLISPFAFLLATPTRKLVLEDATS